MAFPDYTYSFLKQFHYQNNEFGPASCEALADLVEIQCADCKLESFKMNNVKIQNALPTTINLMKTVLKEIPGLKTLQLANINLNSPTIVSELIEVIMNHHTLEIMSLSATNLQPN